jgi:hypothetical protein
MESVLGIVAIENDLEGGESLYSVEGGDGTSVKSKFVIPS